MWFRTLHSSNDDYFAWVVNANGTISSKKAPKLVLGYGISPNEQHWGDLSNHYGWRECKKLEGFDTTSGQVDMGKCLKIVGEDRWMEIPYASMEECNFAWLRTHHGGDPAHFSYSWNKDGTISPATRPDLVFGLADPTPCSKFRDVIANHRGWRENRAEKRAAESKEV